MEKTRVKNNKLKNLIFGTAFVFITGLMSANLVAKEQETVSTPLPLDTPKAAASHWLNGLLLGRDMSAVSSDFASQLKSQNNRFITPKSIDSLYADQATDLQKHLRQFKGTPASQDFLKEKVKQLIQTQKQRVKQLKQVRKSLIADNVSEFKINKLDEFIKLIQQESTFLKQSINSNNLAQVLKQSDWAKQSKLKTTNSPTGFVLRNNQLPYGRRNGSLPGLNWDDVVIASYNDADASLPTAEDYSVTKIVPLSPKIMEQAASLDHDYIKIYNFVRQNIRTEYYAGAMKGAEGTLESYAGNDVDQAALLIALLRASNVPARFVHGIANQPIDQVVNALGLADTQAVITALQEAGIAYQPVVTGGMLRAIQYQTTWVSAYVPYSHYRGSANDFSEPLWIPLAPSIKEIEFQSHTFNPLEEGMDADGLTLEYLNQAQSQSGSPQLFWQNRLQNFLDVNNLSWDQLNTTPENVTRSLKLLPSSLPFKVEQVNSESATLSADYQQFLQISANHDGQNMMSIQLSMAEITGKRLSLSYLPATVDDLNIINSFGGMAHVPPYLVELQPWLQLDGISMETGTHAIGMGQSHEIQIKWLTPGGEYQQQRQVLAGSYLSLNVGTQGDTFHPDVEDVNLINDETKPIRLMHNLGRLYDSMWSDSENQLARLMNMALVRPTPSMNIIAPEYSLGETAGFVTSMNFKGMSIDALWRSVEPIHRSANHDLERYWLRLSGLQGSWLESSIFQSQWVMSAVSADIGLQQQMQLGNTLIQVDEGNLTSVLPTLNHSQVVKNELSLAIDQGYMALINQNAFMENSWQGSAWLVWDEETGNIGSFISGVYAGGQTTEDPNDWAFEDLRDMLNAPYAEGTNNDPNAASYINKIQSTDGQIATVGQNLPKMTQVLVTDRNNRPVKGANVRFNIIMGNAQIIGESGSLSNSRSVTTNEQGIAEIDIQLGEEIYAAIPHQMDPNDEYPTMIGFIFVEASVNSQFGAIRLEDNFTHYQQPDVAAEIKNIHCKWNNGNCLSFVGHPGIKSGVAHFKVVDQYNNTVTNTPVQITGLESYLSTTNKTAESTTLDAFSNQAIATQTKPSDIEAFKSASCELNKPARIAVGACFNPKEVFTPGCSDTSVTIKSAPTWVSYDIYNGEGRPTTVYPIELSAAGLPPVNFNSQNTSAGLYHSGEFYIGPNGNYFGGKPESTIEKFTQPLYVEYVGDTNNSCTQNIYKLTAPSQMTTESTQGDANLLASYIGDGEISGQYQLSTTIGFNKNNIDIPNANFNDGNGDLNFNPDVQLVVDSTTVKVELLSRTPEFFDLNDESVLRTPVTFMALISPAEYHPLNVTAHIKEGERIIFSNQINSPSEAVIEVIMPAGLEMDTDMEYFIEFVFNENTDAEFNFDPISISNFQQRIVTELSCDDNSSALSNARCGGQVVNLKLERPVKLSSYVDFANDRSCSIEGFEINLTRNSNVTIAAQMLDLSGQPSGVTHYIVQDESMLEGVNSVYASLNNFNSGRYQLTINSMADDTGEEETVTGELVVDKYIDNPLPIGHAIVKGVDLADGSMVYSKKDISLTSPGSDLEFIRTYSSQARNKPGPLGLGWNHNFMSRVIKGKCGQYIVSGADAGSARFFLEGDQFVPAKGYHSSLKLNEDGTFDFFPKGGNRYHYVRARDNVWWISYIEDPNGNRLTIDLVNRPNAPLIRSVTDSVGRRLEFVYTSKDIMVASNQGSEIWELLTQVRGPENIVLDIEYDDYGRILSARREGDSTQELFSYPTDGDWIDRGLLEGVIDEATGAVRNWSYEARTFTPTANMTGIDPFEGVQVKSITESDSGITTFQYTLSTGYNEAAQVTQNSTITNYALNSYGAATQITAPNGTKYMNWNITDDVLLDSETDENGRVRSFTYDEYGNVLTESIDDISRSYTYEPPSAFNPPYIKDRVKTMTNWRGKTTTYQYDSKGNRIEENLDGISRKYSYFDNGLLRTLTDGRSLLTRFTYDVYGYPLTQTDPLNNLQKTVFNARGQKRSETDANNNITTYSYDDSDRVIQKKLNQRLWKYSYENGGLVKTETDPNEHSTTYTYDTAGRLLDIQNAKQDHFTYTYDLNGNKLSENDFGGHVTTFTYDLANRLETKTEPQGSAGTHKITTYTYDNVGNVLSETTGNRVTEYEYDPKRYFQTKITRKSSSGDVVISRTVDGEGNVLSEIDANENETIFTYDGFNRVLTASGPENSGMINVYDGNGNLVSNTVLNSTGNQVRIYGYDLANRQNSITDAENKVTTMTHDGNGNIKTETNPGGYHVVYRYNDLNQVVSKAINRYEWRMDYDAAGNLKHEYWAVLDNVPTNVITYDYDELNRKTSASDIEGVISTTTYDADGNVKTQTDGNQQTATFAYNDLHQRINETLPLDRGHSYTYTLFGELLTDTGPNGTITYTVNDLGRRTATTGPDNLNLSFSYDRNGNLTSQTDSRNIETIFTINALNQTTGQTTNDFVMTMTYDTVGNKTSVTDYRGIVSTWTYDKENRQITFTRDGKLQSTTLYNEAGLPRLIKDANGNNAVHEYNAQYFKTRTILPESQVIGYTPDAFGDVTFQDNPGPNDITRVYDARRRLTSETNGAGETTRYEYDGNNNRTAVVKPGGQRWEYGFDEANRLTSVKNVPEAIETKYQYDNADNLEVITDAENKETRFTYDNSNRKKSKTYPDTQVVTHDYDANGNLILTSLPNGTDITFDYDDLNRQYQQNYSGTLGTATVTLTLDGNGNVENVTESIDGQVHNTVMDYDNLDRLTLKTDRYNNTFIYTYDNNGNRKSFRDHTNISTSYNYDGLNRLKQLSRAGLGAFDWTYNAAGLPERIDYPNGSTANYSYDEANRIDLIDNRQSGVTVTSHDYDYDLNGNRTKLTESNIDAAQITSYTYDDADRLTQVNYPTSIHTYTLDKVGNRKSEVIDNIGQLNTRTYGYNTRDQLKTITDTDGLDISYDYDEAGNQTQKTENGVTTTFNYTPRQRVKTITVGGAPPVQYQYDYAGQRVNYQYNGAEKRYLYDGLTLIAETNTLGNTLATYHYGTTRQLAETRNGQNAFYLADALGTNVAITNQDGSIQNRMDYDVWGNLKQESASSDSPFGFTGYIKDQETDLYYANARYYDSFTGRFLREDPFEGDFNTPPSLHRYLYAYVNPNKYFDPDGMTAAQFDELMTTAVEKFLTSGNRTALGDTGELVLEKILRANGEVIIKGPVSNPGKHKADVISFNPETNQLSFFDNKIQSLKENVSRAPAIASTNRKVKAIEDAQLMLENLDLDPKLKIKIQKELKLVRDNPSRGVWAIANGSAEDFIGVENKVKRISQRLVDKGILFADVVPSKGEVNILSKTKSVSNGKRILNSIAVVGTALSVAEAEARLRAANQEDQLFSQAMQDLGINDPIFANNSLKREIVVISAEEAGGSGGFMAGASAASGPSVSCGWFYPACVLAGGIVGSIIGDSGGGAAAGYAFDKANEPTYEQIQEMRMKIRELRRDTDFKIISEDSEEAGGQ